MNESRIKQAYDIAVERYAELGIDVEAVLDKLQQVEISMHCWQADDVADFFITAKTPYLTIY